MNERIELEISNSPDAKYLQQNNYFRHLAACYLLFES